MKHLSCLLAVLLLSYSAAAQDTQSPAVADSTTIVPMDTVIFGSKLTAIAGGAFPVGEYAETTGGHPGFATTGFLAGIEYTVHADSLALLVSPGWISTLLVSVNGSDQSGVQDALLQEFNIPPEANATVEAGSWITASVMTGFEGTYQFARNWSLGLQSQFGFVVGSSSLVKLASERGAITQNSSIAAAPCFSAGIAATMLNQFTLGIRYHSATITYDIRTINPDGTSNAVYYGQPSNLLSLYLGYTFATFRHQSVRFAEEGAGEQNLE